MKVIQVYGPHHRTICLAATVQDAIDYLFATSWIEETTPVWDGLDQCWVSILDYFGENWKDQISSMSLEQFNDMFEDDFSLCPVGVYERQL